MQVARWGNSLAIRLPVAVARALELREGDEVTVRIAGPREMEVARAPGQADLLKRLDAFEGRLPADFTWHRDDAQRA